MRTKLSILISLLCVLAAGTLFYKGIVVEREAVVLTAEATKGQNEGDAPSFVEEQAIQVKDTQTSTTSATKETQLEITPAKEKPSTTQEISIQTIPPNSRTTAESVQPQTTPPVTVTILETPTTILTTTAPGPVKTAPPTIQTTPPTTIATPSIPNQPGLQPPPASYSETLTNQLLYELNQIRAQGEKPLFVAHNELTNHAYASVASTAAGGNSKSLDAIDDWGTLSVVEGNGGSVEQIVTSITGGPGNLQTILGSENTHIGLGVVQDGFLLHYVIVFGGTL